MLETQRQQNQDTKDNRAAKVALAKPGMAGMAYPSPRFPCGFPVVSPWCPHVSVTKTHDEIDELNELDEVVDLYV